MQSMKKLNLLVAITAACSALISGLQAATITYSIVNNAGFQNGYTLSGSITTDGTIGDVTLGILGWNWTVTDNATSAVVRSLSGNGAAGSYFVQASATQIILKPFGENSRLDLGGGGVVSWNRRAAEDFGFFEMPASDEYYFQYNSTNFWMNSGSGAATPLQSTADGSWIIADGGVSAVPEPSAFALLGLSAFGLIVRRRRCA